MSSNLPGLAVLGTSYSIHYKKLRRIRRFRESYSEKKCVFPMRVLFKKKSVNTSETNRLGIISMDPFPVKHLLELATSAAEEIFPKGKTTLKGGGN